MNLRVMFLFGCLLAVCGCSSAAAPAPELISGTGMTNLRVLLRAYNENNLTANKQYGRKWLKVSGYVIGEPGEHVTADGGVFVLIAENPDVEFPTALFEPAASGAVAAGESGKGENVAPGREDSEEPEMRVDSDEFEESARPDEADLDAADTYSLEGREAFGGLSRVGAGATVGDRDRNININRRNKRNRHFLVCALEPGQKTEALQLREGQPVIVFGLLNPRYWKSGEVLERCQLLPVE